MAWVEFRVLLARMVWNFKFDVCPHRAPNENDVSGNKSSQARKTTGFSAFGRWTDLKAFMLWQKESYFVWLSERY